MPSNLQEAIPIISLLLSVIGGIFVLFQWSESNKLKRAEYVDKLFSMFNSSKNVKYAFSLIDYEKDWYNENFHGSGHLEEAMDEMLNYYSYMCYLYKNKLIKENEFEFYKYQVLTILNNTQIKHYLYNVYHYTKAYHTEMNFYYLFDYGEKLKVFEKEFYNPKSKKYPHHLKLPTTS